MWKRISIAVINRFLSIIIFILFVQVAAGQQKIGTTTKPKLIVGIVVDQMRWDFLYRYQERYTEGGFKRLLNEGFSCENTLIPYMPTYTAPGHSTIFTGSVPSLHGIIGNNWFSKKKNRIIYCTEDSSVRTIGSSSGAGNMSPSNMKANTITDELRIAENFRNKTIAISLKDRGSILPGGHTGNQSYWFDASTGNFISSSYYMNKLPEWVKSFNNKKLPDFYLNQNWHTLYPSNTYHHSTGDTKNYEDNLPGEDASFPHITDAVQKSRYSAFLYTPHANTYIIEMAKQALMHEKLGQGLYVDFLALSFSSPDYMGHAFGPNSVEAEDMYLRLDRNIADFLEYLDENVGKGNYLVFLTADHGVAHVADYARENKMPGGVINSDTLKQRLNNSLDSQFQKSGLIASIINYQVYLNDRLIKESKLDIREIKKTLIRTLIDQEGISHAFDLDNIREANLPARLGMMAVNGYHQELSGDIMFLTEPQWYTGWTKGTTHGSWNPYDAHIPLVWYGWKIPKGKLYRTVYMTDIAPTLAALLQIQAPNASVGEVIYEMVKVGE